METLLPIFLIPIIWAFIAKRILHKTINWQEMSITIGVACLIGAIVWGLGHIRADSDVELLNGQITAKKRVHDDYLESYSCNCHTTCSGTGQNRSCSESCQTCYRRHYTVDWFAESTIGRIMFKSLDETDDDVYKEPDPNSYKRCIVGEPATKTHSYTNHVIAAPESLFHLKAKIGKKSLVPPYPVVFDFYRVNRVLYVGGSANQLPVNFIRTLNTNISNDLRALGKTKQVNVIFIATDNPDRSYRYEVENAWLGGKKNDVVVFYSAKAGELQWVDVMTWARNYKNELFQVKLRDALLDTQVLDADAISKTISTHITRYYDRPRMSEFKYLRDSIEPPMWVLVLAYVLVLSSCIGLTFFFHRENATPFSDIISELFNRKRFSRKNRFR